MAQNVQQIYFFGDLKTLCDFLLLILILAQVDPMQSPKFHRWTASIIALK